jgi:hypothetical protein
MRNSKGPAIGFAEPAPGIRQPGNPASGNPTQGAVNESRFHF